MKPTPANKPILYGRWHNDQSVGGDHLTRVTGGWEYSTDGYYNSPPSSFKGHQWKQEEPGLYFTPSDADVEYLLSDTGKHPLCADRFYHAPSITDRARDYLGKLGYVVVLQKKTVTTTTHTLTEERTYGTTLKLNNRVAENLTETVVHTY